MSTTINRYRDSTIKNKGKIPIRRHIINTISTLYNNFSKNSLKLISQYFLAKYNFDDANIIATNIEIVGIK